MTTRPEPHDDPNQTNINQVDGDFVNRDKAAGSIYNAAGDIHIYPNSDGSQNRAIPNMLPRRNTNHFTGRTADLEWIKTGLTPAQTLVLIGPGGMGKTTLAIEALHQLAEAGELAGRFPDGIIFHTFYGRPDINLAFETIVTAYGQEPSGDLEQQTRHLLSSKTPLVILDGCEDVQEHQSLRKVVDVLGNSGVLITTRAAKQGGLGQPRNLERLEPAEAQTLLQTLAHPAAIPDATCAELCQQVDHLPLGVNIAGNYLREAGDPHGYLTWLKEKPLEALDQGETRRESMYRMVEKSVGRLDQWGQELLQVLGQLAYLPVPLWAVESMLGMEPNSLYKHTGDLSRYGLAKLESGNITCTHALVHGFVRDELCTDRFDEEEMLPVVCEWLNTNYRAWRAETPPNWAYCDGLRPHIVPVIGQLEGRERWQEAEKLVWAVEDYLDLRGHFVERNLVLEAGIHCCQKLGDRRGEGNHLGNLGLAYYSLGRVEEAIKYYQDALVISREIRDRRGEGAHLGNLGIAYKDLGRVEEAIKYHEDTLEISREIGDRHGEGADLGNLGIAYYELEQHDKVLDLLEEAATISQEIGDVLGYANHISNIAEFYKDVLDDKKEAEALWRKALAIYQKAKHPHAARIQGYLDNL